MIKSKPFTGLPQGVDRSNPYSILGITENASPRSLAKALKRARKRLESLPIKTALSDQDERDICHAWSVLMIPEMRAAYDQTGTFDEPTFRYILAWTALLSHTDATTLVPCQVRMKRTGVNSYDDPYGVLLDEVSGVCLLTVDASKICGCLITGPIPDIPGSLWIRDHFMAAGIEGHADSGLTITYHGSTRDYLVRTTLALTPPDPEAEHDALAKSGLSADNSTSHVLKEIERNVRSTLGIK